MKNLRSSLVGIVSCAALVACKSTSGASGVKDASIPEATAATNNAGGDATALDTAIGEKLWDGEQTETGRIRDAIVSTVKPSGGPDVTPPLHPADSMMRRDAHPKAHGCVEARFQVLDGIDPVLAKGIFAAPREFDATIRFSNGSGDPTHHDIKGDGRGMAIKVHGVEGNRLVAGGDQDSQDFIMINYPLFFVAKPQTYLPIIKAVSDGSIFNAIGAAKAVAWEPRDAWVIAQLATIKILNPVQEQYWSEVPYRLGEAGEGKAIKFSAKPVECEGSDPMPGLVSKKLKIAELTAASLVSDKDHDYLRKALVQSLDPNAPSPKQACFDFQIQLAQPGDSVEDPRWTWTGAFTTVARVTIKAQTFDTPDQDMACEKLSYSPWDGLTAHKPLGGVNRIRRVVYEAVSAKRHGG